MTSTSPERSLLALLAGLPPCHECGTRPDDPDNPAAFEFDIDLEAGDYGEEGWVRTPQAEAMLRCTRPDPDRASGICGTFQYLDIDVAAGIAEKLVNQAIGTVVGK